MKKILYIATALLLISCEYNFPTWEKFNTEWLNNNEEVLGTSSKVDTTFVLSSGVQCEVFHMGYGATPKPSIDPAVGRSSIIEVKYVGSLPDGTIFDQTDSTDTRKFYLSDCITGWQQALGKVKQGSHLKIYIPSEEGYGNVGTRDAYGNYNIPPYSTLIFEIELIDVIN